MPATGQPSRTDRGYVVVSKMRDGRHRVEVCERVSAEGKAINVYAEHVGVPEVVTQARGTVHSNRRWSSTEPLEVFDDSEDGKLHVAVMQDWSQLRA